VWIVQSFTLARKFKSNQETLLSEATVQSTETKTDQDSHDSLSLGQTSGTTGGGSALEEAAAMQPPQSASAGDTRDESRPTAESQDDDTSSTGYDTDQADNNSVIS